MKPLPALSLKPEDIGKELTPDQITLLAHSFVTLVNYTQAEHARCGTPVP